MALNNRQTVLIQNCLKRVFNVLLDEVEDIIDEELNRKKRLWKRDWNGPGTTSNHDDGFVPLYGQLLTDEHNKVDYSYRSCLKITTENFNTLLNMVSSMIQKEDTLLREAIPSEVMLDVTLNFLATGNSYRNLQQLYRVSNSAISNFIPQVCDAICVSLNKYIKFPSTGKEWQIISDGFRDQWNFPGCCGALDGKHILVNPSNGVKECYNYEGSSSVVLLVISDHNYCVSYFEVVKKSSRTENRAFQNSFLIETLEKGLLPEKNFLVGDDAFPLKPYLMKPYTTYNNSLSQDEKIFNYRLSRARRTVENIFGIIFSRFRAFDRKLAIRLETINKLIKTACALHNWLTITSTETYLPEGTIDKQNSDTGDIAPGQWRSEVNELHNLERYGAYRTTKQAETVRDELKDYFNGEGAVPWQYKVT